MSIFFCTFAAAKVCAWTYINIMVLSLAIFSALLPALLLLLYIFIRDKYQREPWREVLRAFGWGVLSVGLAIVAETLLQMFGVVSIGGQSASILGSIWNAFVGAAIPEELSKILVLWLCLRSNRHFDEYMDGIVYAVAVGMGFAGIENIAYVLDNIDNWQSIAIARSLTAVPGHYMFAVAMGFFYSMGTFFNSKYYAYAFIVPIVLHGVYDSLLFMMQVDEALALLLVLVFVVFLSIALAYASKAIDKHLRADIEILTRQQNEQD